MITFYSSSGALFSVFCTSGDNIRKTYLKCSSTFILPLMVCLSWRMNSSFPETLWTFFVLSFWCSSNVACLCVTHILRCLNHVADHVLSKYSSDIWGSVQTSFIFRLFVSCVSALCPRVLSVRDMLPLEMQVLNFVLHITWNISGKKITFMFCLSWMSVLSHILYVFYLSFPLKW